MPTNPYTSVTISGYLSSPPPDDGSQTAANEIVWQKHVDKIGNPIKNRQDTINSRLVTAFGKMINRDADEDNPMGGALAFTEKIFTIASGAITPTRSNVVLAAESGATDTLDSMATGSVSDDTLLMLSVDTGDTITINDAGGAAGQIHLVDSQDLILSGNDRLFLIRDGADWYEISRPVAIGLTSISNTAITAITNIDVTGFLPSVYDNYEVWISNGQPGNDNVVLEMETSTDGGSSYDVGGSDYSWAGHTTDEVPSGAETGAGDDTEIELTLNDGVGNAANENVSGKIYVFSPETTEFTTFAFHTLHRNESGVFFSNIGAASRQSAADVDALRFHWSAGDWAAQGTIQFLGIRQ